MKEVGGLSSSPIFQKRTPDVLGREHALTKSEKALALQRANAFKSAYPSFPVAIQPAYIHSSYLVCFMYNTFCVKKIKHIRFPLKEQNHNSLS